MRCEPERKSYQNWHTLSLEQSSSSGSGSGSISSSLLYSGLDLGLAGTHANFHTAGTIAATATTTPAAAAAATTSETCCCCWRR